MSTNGLDVFDKTLQTTHIWLDDIMAAIGPDRSVAWKVLSAVLHKLRDRLPLEMVAHLGAQMPLLIRGVYYDRFDPTIIPTNWSTADQFVEEVASELAGSRRINAKDAIHVVLGALDDHISEGQMDKVYRALPKSIRALW